MPQSPICHDVRRIAAEAGVNFRTVYGWIRGTRKPHPLHGAALEAATKKLGLSRAVLRRADAKRLVAR